MVTTRFPVPCGGHSATWGYGYADLRLLLGYRTEGAVRAAVRRGAFDPSDLASIFAFREKRRAQQRTP